MWLLRRPSVAHVRAVGLADGAADIHSDGSADSDADRYANSCAVVAAFALADVCAVGLTDGAADIDSDNCADCDADRDADNCAVLAALVHAHARSIGFANGASNTDPDSNADLSPNCNADGRAVVGAIANAHVRAFGLADGAADVRSYGFADSDAHKLSDICAEPSADFAVLHLGTKSEHHFLRGRLWRHMSDAPRRVRCDGWSRICQRRMRHGELRMLLFLSEPSANDSDLRGGGVGLRSRCLRKRRGAVLFVQRIVHGRGRREL